VPPSFLRVAATERCNRGPLHLGLGRGRVLYASRFGSRPRTLRISVWVEAGYPLRRLLAYTLRASRANYNGARESLATRDAAYEDTLPLPHTSLTARAALPARDATPTGKQLA
jgi:hypothetical protein